MNNSTLQYYNQNAEGFAAGTISVDFKANQDRFLASLEGVVGEDNATSSNDDISRLREGLSSRDRALKILDFGCGSGRDTKYFLDRGYSVTATDGSEELCRIASEYTGIQVQQMLFSELSAVSEYDGIWACSSILHLLKNELKDVLRKMLIALKPHGIIYTSFKYGEFEGERNGRYFTDFTEESFAEFVKDIDGLQITAQWITGDVRAGRSEEKWLNLLLRKK